MKLFIIHNGVNSTYEAISNEVPMVFYPRVKDQLVNASKVENADVGMVVKDGEDGPIAKSITDVSNDLSSCEKKAKQLK